MKEQQFNQQERFILALIGKADKLSNKGNKRDAQKLYKDIAQAMLALKADLEYNWENGMKTQFVRVFKKL